MPTDDAHGASTESGRVGGGIAGDDAGGSDTAKAETSAEVDNHPLFAPVSLPNADCFVVS